MALLHMAIMSDNQVQSSALLIPKDHIIVHLKITVRDVDGSEMVINIYAPKEMNPVLIL